MAIFIEEKIIFFGKFKDLKVLVQNQVGKKIKLLRIANGGEFCGMESDQFYK